eukprot:SAG11_NODE_54_length_19571_cov_29.437786_12_plen_189_part_00
MIDAQSSRASLSSWSPANAELQASAINASTDSHRTYDVYGRPPLDSGKVHEVWLSVTDDHDNEKDQEDGDDSCDAGEDDEVKWQRELDVWRKIGGPVRVVRLDQTLDSERKTEKASDTVLTSPTTLRPLKIRTHEREPKWAPFKILKFTTHSTDSFQQHRWKSHLDADCKLHDANVVMSHTLLLLAKM